MKYNITFALALALTLTACDEKQEVLVVEPEPTVIPEGVSFTVPDFQYESMTRTDFNSAANIVWTDNDTIGVFPENGYQTAFPISEGEIGTNRATFDGGDWALRPLAKYAAYYPFIQSLNFDKTKVPVSFVGQEQTGNGSSAHIGAYDYLAATYHTVSEEGNVNFVMNHLVAYARFVLTMPEADSYSEFSLSTVDAAFVNSGIFDITAEPVAIAAKETSKTFTMALTNAETTEGNKVLTLYAMFAPVDLSSKTLTITVQGAGANEYKATIDGKNMQAGNGYGYAASLAMVPKHNGHEYVDLGIKDANGNPVYWATCNLGAESPEVYGDKFAWGETATKDLFGWNYYQHGTSDTKLTKYCLSPAYGTVDNKTILDPEDDAATVNWGDGWRMPTKEEWDQLLDCSWKTNSYGDVLGYIVSGNGNSIFLPSDDNGSSAQGYYWLSTLNTSNSGIADICRFHCYSNSHSIQNYNRSYSARIRPVYSNFVFVRSIELSGASSELEVGDMLQLNANVLPAGAGMKDLTWSTSDETIATVSTTGQATAVAAGTVTIKATAKDGSNSFGSYTITVTAAGPDANGHEYVDLGITSNGKPLYWATCNVGATQPEEYGDYFAWGETEPYYTEGHSLDNPCSNWKSGKSGYNWSSYKWCNGSSSTQTKYCTISSYGTVDNKTVLDAEDDAAVQNWGGDWRMPTDAEMTLLRNNCYWEWTTNYKSTNKAGYIVYKAKSDSDKGKYSYKNPSLSASYSISDTHIFLPAAGYRNESNLVSEGSFGGCWSSSLYTSNSNFAYFLYFYSSEVRRNNNSRYYGRSVRPVCQ